MQGLWRGLASILVASFVALVALVALAFAFANRPADLDTARIAKLQDGDPEHLLAASEAAIDRGPGIVPQTAKRILWADPNNRQPTELSVVYLHGFSATRQETAPYAELLARALGANLFESRLAGHGLRSAQLEDVTAEDWLADAAEALDVGERIGSRVVIVGTSTGATLALALRQSDPLSRVAALVLLSPNFGPRDRSADLLTWPGGPLLAEMLVGDTRSWTPANEAQERYWSTRYPLTAVVEMMRLVDAVRDAPPLEFSQPVLAVLSPRDDVIDYPRALEELAQLDVPALDVVEMDTDGDGHHVLAGTILAPQNNAPLLQHTLDFLKRNGLYERPRS